MLLLLTSSLGALVNRLTGPNNTEIAYASAAGGFQVYLSGSGLGTPFNPPTILVGTQGSSTCNVHPKSHPRLKGFSSGPTKMKCVVEPEFLPPPPDTYDSSGSFLEVPLFVVKGGKHADCWHVGGINHGCAPASLPTFSSVPGLPAHAGFGS